VEHGERDLGAGDVDREGMGAHLAPAEHPRCSQPLDAVDNLELALLRCEDRDGEELAHARERALHARHRTGLAQPQRAEPLAERLDRHHALRGLALLHGEGVEQTGADERRLARDRLSQETTESTLSPSVFEGGGWRVTAGITAPPPSQPAASKPAPLRATDARGWRVTVPLRCPTNRASRP